KEREIVIAVMGGATRKGRWAPARRNFAFAVMGGTELDFREAVLPPGVTEVQVFTVMGGVEIIVPPGVNVESHGIGIMGGFDHRGGEGSYDQDAPTLRITGLALMGGVDITERHIGESARDARRRRKLEAKERGRLRDSWE
ncbi:MAG TPA: LiaF domain-containing protein, partial [Longimicrobiales bacterium]|nr:LiaF domain-containing protein [Longimicrobiales bacterium]